MRLRMTSVSCGYLSVSTNVKSGRLWMPDWLNCPWNDAVSPLADHLCPVCGASSRPFRLLLLPHPWIIVSHNSRGLRDYTMLCWLNLKIILCLELILLEMYFSQTVFNFYFQFKISLSLKFTVLDIYGSYYFFYKKKMYIDLHFNFLSSLTKFRIYTVESIVMFTLRFYNCFGFIHILWIFKYLI